MKQLITRTIFAAAIFAPAFFAEPALALQGDFYVCETQHAVFISSDGVENIEAVTFEFYWGAEQLEVSEGWTLTEYENFFTYSYQERETFAVQSAWGMINYDAPSGVMTIYIPRANEMYSYWATCRLRDR